MSARLLLPVVRDLFEEHPRAARLSADQIAALLWILRYVPEPVEAFYVEGVLEALDIERGAA